LTHLVKPAPKSRRFRDLYRDYVGYLAPFIKRVDRWHQLPPFIVLKTIEYSVYRWYAPPIETWQNHKYELIYEITRHCTDRCQKCGIWGQPEGARIPVDQVIQSIISIRRNIEKVTITGGEPLIYMQDVIGLCQATHNAGIPTSVITNGCLIDDELLELIRDTHTELVISIDTLDESKWHQYRGRDHFDIVKRNLDKAVATVAENVCIQSVLADETKEDVPAVAEYCALNEITHYIQEYQDFGGTWHATSNDLLLDSGGVCSAWLNICIYPNGDVVKCFDHFRIPEASEPLGNIAEGSIVEILSSERCVQVMELMKRCDLPCKTLRCNQRGCRQYQ